MQHHKARNLVGKDQARRLKFQELQRIKSKCNGFVDTKKCYGTFELSEGQLKVYVGKLVK